MGTRRTASSTAYTILDRADGATDVLELANRNLEEVAHVSRSEPDDLSLDNSSAPRRNQLFPAPGSPMLGNFLKRPDERHIFREVDHVDLLHLCVVHLPETMYLERHAQ